MPGTVTVPSTLKGHAATIWRATFLGAYDGTCAKREDRDACAAAIAWSSVKEKYKQTGDGQWVEKSWTTGLDARPEEVQRHSVADAIDIQRSGRRRPRKFYGASQSAKKTAEIAAQTGLSQTTALGVARSDEPMMFDDDALLRAAVPGIFQERGGAGSGFFGHSGRPGEVGGSAGEGGGGGKAVVAGEGGKVHATYFKSAKDGKWYSDAHHGSLAEAQARQAAMLGDLKKAKGEGRSPLYSHVSVGHVPLGDKSKGTYTPNGLTDAQMKGYAAAALKDAAVSSGGTFPHSGRQVGGAKPMAERGGHFGHEGRPGELGGSAPSGTDGHKRKLAQAILDNPDSTPHSKALARQTLAGLSD